MSREPAPGGPDRGTCEVVLFHSALGLRPAVLAWADRLRAEGHVVHTPDLYDGEVFEEMEPAFAKIEAIGGIPALMERSHAAVAGLPADLVYAGFSNGGGSAELLALTRPGARGAVLMHAALPVEAFGADGWPAGVPVQVHYGAGDPYRDPAAIEAVRLAAERSGAGFEAWDYACSGHLFADPGLPDYCEPAAGLMLERVLAFLRELASRKVGAASSG
jgi:dienelactone hydrolase